MNPTVIIDALLQGVKDGQDILTLSLGGADGWTSGAGAVVASRIAKTGKIVTIAAGNDVRTPDLACRLPLLTQACVGFCWLLVQLKSRQCHRRHLRR